MRDLALHITQIHINGCKGNPVSASGMAPFLLESTDPSDPSNLAAWKGAAGTNNGLFNISLTGYPVTHANGICTSSFRTQLSVTSYIDSTESDGHSMGHLVWPK